MKYFSIFIIAGLIISFLALHFSCEKDDGHGVIKFEDDVRNNLN